jgi:hypothetical protein
VHFILSSIASEPTKTLTSAPPPRPPSPPLRAAPRWSSRTPAVSTRPSS